MSVVFQIRLSILFKTSDDIINSLLKFNDNMIIDWSHKSVLILLMMIFYSNFAYQLFLWIFLLYKLCIIKLWSISLYSTDRALINPPVVMCHTVKKSRRYRLCWWHYLHMLCLCCCRRCCSQIPQMSNKLTTRNIGDRVEDQRLSAGKMPGNTEKNCLFQWGVYFILFSYTKIRFEHKMLLLFLFVWS